LFKLCYLTNEKLEKLLHYALPSEWRNKSLVSWHQDAPSTVWLDSLWKFLDREHNYTAFSAWPLIPTNNGLVKLEIAHTILFLDARCPAPVRAVLERTGCHILMPQVREVELRGGRGRRGRRGRRGKRTIYPLRWHSATANEEGRTLFSHTTLQ
jgi:hypothetical protein